MLLLVFIPKQHRVIRIAAALHIVAAVATMVVQTPMGGNINRLTMFFAGPILAAVIPVDRRKLLLLLAVPLLYWQWSPSIRRRRRRAEPTPAAPPSSTRHSSPSSTMSSPSRARCASRSCRRSRHWEVAEVAPAIPIARGWWRQLDMEYNPLFYDGTLDAASYREWLHREAVSYVALPHGELDDAGVGEAALIAGGLPYLELDRVLTDWLVYEVVDPRPIVAGPGTLLEYGAEDLVIRVSEPGTLHVAVRASPHWKLTGPAGCLAESSDGFVDITDVEPGILRLTIDVEFSALWDGSPDGCASPP